jgi:hypothetical protein
MKATQTYDRVTGGRPLSVKVHEWIADLVTRFGDDEVAAALEAEAPGLAEKGKLSNLLYAVRDRLAKAQHRHELRAPTEISGQEMLAICRGQRTEPDPPYVWDTRGLTGPEYREILAWRAGPRDQPWR